MGTENHTIILREKNYTNTVKRASGKSTLASGSSASLFCSQNTETKTWSMYQRILTAPNGTHCMLCYGMVPPNISHLSMQSSFVSFAKIVCLLSVLIVCYIQREIRWQIVQILTYKKEQQNLCEKSSKIFDIKRALHFECLRLNGTISRC